MKKFITACLLSLFAITNVYAISPYVKGYRLYIRYIKHIPRYGIKAPDLLKKLNVHTGMDLDNLFKNNAQELIQKTQIFNPKAAKAIQKIVNKGKLKYLQTFLQQVFYGKVPLG